MTPIDTAPRPAHTPGPVYCSFCGSGFRSAGPGPEWEHDTTRCAGGQARRTPAVSSERDQLLAINADLLAALKAAEEELANPSPEGAVRR